MVLSWSGHGHGPDALPEIGVGGEFGEFDPGVHLLGCRVIGQFGGQLAHVAGDAHRRGLRVHVGGGAVDEVIDDLLRLAGGQPGRPGRLPDGEQLGGGAHDRRLCTFQPLEAQGNGPLPRRRGFRRRYQRPRWTSSSRGLRSLARAGATGSAAGSGWPTVNPVSTYQYGIGQRASSRSVQPLPGRAYRSRETSLLAIVTI